ncbi:fimbrial protein FimI [Salmonella enterica subsp. arizonae]|uniref:Fimbrial protein FimI n=1 Tax=Salmonella enterica subsp. arizonae TaxID=59203 RepID=A0A379SYC4_SALER|nr:fimbrial protein FimI [Salmonella enterica subsp. arizonae]
MIRKGAALVGLLWLSPVIAQPVMVESGRIHLRGQLVNGGCVVATESQDLRVLMGQYRTNAFAGPGSFAPVSVPFSLRLISCSAEVWRHVGIAFAGVTPAEDPHVFWPAAKVSGMPESAWRYLTISSGKSYLTRYRFITRPF